MGKVFPRSVRMKGKDVRDKRTIREAMRARRAALTDEAARELSRAAQERVLGDAAWKRARCVGLYMAVRRETDTRRLLESALRDGKRVVLPFVPHDPPPGAEGTMRLLPYETGRALAAGAFGIPAPTPETCPSYGEGDEWIPDLVIVPGTAFDRAGRRIGSGGGYYDRLFAAPSLRETARVGLAYAFQVLESVPADPWDAPMHAIATEESIVWL